MSDINNPHELSHFSQPARLRDGTPVLIRAIRPDDMDRVVAAFHKLDPQSIYSRFFTHKRELSAGDLRRLGGADFVHAAVLVVSLAGGADETLIGGVSYYVRTAADAKPVAEIAFTIEEDYQGQGLAGQLLALATGIARSQGIARFEADVLASNAAMLRVFQHSGLPMTKTADDGVVHVVLELGEPEAPKGAG
jgi:RimJ/RimL family protein N-acetyltransferase